MEEKNIAEIKFKRLDCDYIQQDNSESNEWQCSECKEDIWWGESGDDVDIKYCPYCGKKIKEFSRIKDDEDVDD